MRKSRYYHWMLEKIGAINCQYTRALEFMDSTEFVPIIEGDEARMVDGLSLRDRFTYDQGKPYDNNSKRHQPPCTVLEMMVALSLRIEEHIMEDSDYGDRTPVWFWAMFSSLGLDNFIDDAYNEAKVDKILMRFIYRRYNSNGRGGLFTVENPKRDMRTVEIWYQACWYLDGIIFSGDEEVS